MNKQGVAVGDNILIVSSDSGHNLEDILNNWMPDKVALSFCPMREEVVTKWDSLGSKKLIDYLREKGGFFSLISQLFYFSIYSSMQKEGSMGLSTTLAAREAAEKKGLGVIYMEQNLDVMVKRAWRQIPFKEKLAFTSLFKRELLSLEKNRKGGAGHPDVQMMEQIMEAAPSSRTALEEERMEHMALSILEAAESSRVLVVVGGDMLDKLVERIRGMKADTERKTALETVPAKFRLIWLRWILAAFLLSVFIYTLIDGGWSQTVTTLKWWFIATSVSAMMGAIIARAHPYSIAAAFISAPFISFTFIGAGWIAGMVELNVREPTVSDITELRRMSSWKELFTNKCTKPLAVGFITNGANWTGIIVFMPFLLRSIA